VTLRIGDRLLFRPTLIIAAISAASPALAARCPHGQLYRVHLDECVSLSSALARPYLGRAKKDTIRTAKVSEEVEAAPEAVPPAAADPAAADPPPDEVDVVAWRMIPLLQAIEARWAAIVAPQRVGAPPPDPWPFLSVYALGSFLRARP
jgi:hypothetical protein